MTDHEQKYEAIAQQIGVDKLRAILETGTYSPQFSTKVYKAFPVPSEMVKLIEADKHLNNVPLYRWDAQHNRVWGLLKGTGIKSWALCDTVCVLKHIAKFHYSEVQS